MNRTVSLVALLAALVALPLSSAHADTITGQVVDENDVGVPGVDIDVKNLGSGGTPPIFNDGTDANGFFTTTLPAGIYLVTFTPPAPPTTTHLITEVDDVIVVGSTPMGKITLPAGVSLSGHVEREGGAPVAGVNVDVIDESTGDNMNLANDFTDAFGNFSVAVPAGPIELRLDATSVVGPTLASTAMPLSPTANLTIPDVTLPPGFTLTGIVRDTGGGAVQEADIDVFDTATAVKLYTPGEETNAVGAFSFVVPAGTWDIEICPQFDDLLVATDLEGVVISASTDLGILVLEDGVVLSGTVRDFLGSTVAGADVDVFESATGASVVVCGDDTNGAGNYAVVVPARTLDVRFTPPHWGMELGRRFVSGIPVGGPTNADGVLPSCPNATNYGTGLAAPGGLVPHITTSGGTPSEGNPNWSIELENGSPGATAVLVLSLGQASIPRFGGTILVALGAGQAFPFVVPLDSQGAATFGPVSLVGAAGFNGYAQFAVQLPGTWSLSDGLQIGFCY